MKKIFTILSIVLITLFFTTSIIAQDDPKVESKSQLKNKVKTEQKTAAKHGAGFVDANGDGYNDNAPDHDGDGIPNGLDEDYQGSGKRGLLRVFTSFRGRANCVWNRKIGV